MEKNSRRKMSIDIFLYVFLVYLLAILMGDYFIYFLHIPYIASIILGFIISGGLFYFLKSKIKIVNDIEKSDIIFFITLVIICAITIVFPDKMFDSLNYHLLNQEQPFKDLLSKYFFPSSNVNSTTYALGDRLFYPIRFILGYRLGLILNYYYLIIIYYQLKKILKNILTNKNKIFIAIALTISTLTLNMLDLLDTYYVDLLSIIAILEVVYLAFFGDKLSSNKNENIIEFCFITFLCGFSFCIKLSNAFFIVILFLVYLCNHKDLFKKINLKGFVLAIVFFLLPFAVYMLDIYVKTGNPVFPFYNSIFHSKYMTDVNFSEGGRLGPHGIKETLIWPVKMIFYPLRANDVIIVEPMWAFGYISAVIYFFYYLFRMILKKDYNKTKFLFSLVTIICFIVWAKFSLGYVRYGLFTLLISELLFASLIADIYSHKLYLLFPCLIILLGYNTYYFVDRYVINPTYLEFHNIFNEGVESYIYNAKHLFDRETSTIIKLPDNSAFAPMVFDSGYMYLTNKNIPIMNLYVHKPELVTEYYKEKMEKLYKSYSGVYSAFPNYRIGEFINILSMAGYEIDSTCKAYHPFFVSETDIYYVCKIRKTETPMNDYYIGNTYYLNIDDNVHFNALIGLELNYESYDKDIYLDIVNENGKSIYNKKLEKNGDMILLEKDFSNKDGRNLTYRLVDEDNVELVDVNFLIIYLNGD